jgi:hypothetical protein
VSAFTFGAVLWLAVLMLLAWLSVAAMAVVLVAGFVYTWQLGEVAS